MHACMYVHTYIIVVTSGWDKPGDDGYRLPFVIRKSCHISSEIFVIKQWLLNQRLKLVSIRSGVK